MSGLNPSFDCHSLSSGRSKKRKSSRKAGPQLGWPFLNKAQSHNGAYKLEELNGKIIPRTWNVTHLKHYFS
uniref:Uncharacterized protein n=1 Tax=Cajanus cajan TaxID=3821 RepID=A0A151R1L0_CAJCA|nr:hypothetical protein KK1_042480 [Cajanus cajan]